MQFMLANKRESDREIPPGKMKHVLSAEGLDPEAFPPVNFFLKRGTITE